MDRVGENRHDDGCSRFVIMPTRLVKEHMYNDGDCCLDIYDEGGVALLLLVLNLKRRNGSTNSVLPEQNVRGSLLRLS